MLIMDIRKIDTYGVESNSQKFTKPLRALLGGKKITQMEDGTSQAKQIANLAARILLALALVISGIGLLYIIPAAIVLAAASKPEKIPALMLKETETKVTVLDTEEENIITEEKEIEELTFAQKAVLVEPKLSKETEEESKITVLCLMDIEKVETVTISMISDSEKKVLDVKPAYIPKNANKQTKKKLNSKATKNAQKLAKEREVNDLYNEITLTESNKTIKKKQ